MGPGVPGMGIASIFYLAAALVAPLREVVKSVRGESSALRWAAVGRQFAVAVGIVSSIVLLYVGFDALMVHGLLGTPMVTDLPGDFPIWTYALGVLILLMMALALASSVLALRVRWGFIGEDDEQITDVYRSSIPVHEDLRPDGVRGRHRASLPPRRDSLFDAWNDLSTTTHVTTGTNQRQPRGRRLHDRHGPFGALASDLDRELSST